MQELLDNRLNPEARLEVEQHLESCEECRRELEALRWTKRFSRQQFAPESVPAKLEEDILAALDLEDRISRAKTGSPRIGRNWWHQRREILAYGLVLVAGVVLALSYFILRAPHRKSPELPIAPASLPSAVAQDYRNYKAEKLPLMLQTGEVKEMESFFSERGIAFQTRVFDLIMMNYRLVGGRVHQLIGRQSALFVYRGKDRQVLICQMYPGQVTELLPTNAILRENNGIRFYIYRVNGLTAVFWQEGVVTCVLISDTDPEEVVQLAFAKAVKI
ncbi:MAG: zf-HC2 domain-containing protein [Acidobacteria bacterium]|nr:zf-HC2 domain-containing protein [Acidobacteriota bacterium]